VFVSWKGVIHKGRPQRGGREGCYECEQKRTRGCFALCGRPHGTSAISSSEPTDSVVPVIRNSFDWLQLAFADDD